MILQYRDGMSPFHRLDPGSKFVWLICVSMLSLCWETTLPQALLFFIVFAIGVIAAQLSLGMLWRAMRIPLWLGVPYFFLQLLFLPGETSLMTLGPLQLTTEALDFATAISLRLLTLVLASYLFVATTDPRDAILALTQQLRVPYRFAFAVAIALRFLPILEQEASYVRAMQQLRGQGQPNKWWNGMARFREFRRFAFTVFKNAIRRVHSIALTMESRAFGRYPTRTFRRELVVTLAGKIVAFVSLGSLVITLIFLFIN
jgi:energy-coupling factor transport system permease protein